VVLVWGIGVVLLVAAGFTVAYLPRAQARALRQRAAWSTARAAIESAAISRDAVGHDVPDAEHLFARAELLAANGGGAATADEATECAERADRLWQETR